MGTGVLPSAQLPVLVLIMKVNQYRNIFILNIIIIATSIICYSPGLLCLRPSDEFFRAGMSIIMAIVLIFAFFYGNYTLMSEKKLTHITRESLPDIDKASSLLKNYYDSKYFGQTSRTARTQLQRMLKSFDSISLLLGEKFEPGSLSWTRYNSIIESAKDSALNNIIVMANRMQVFNEDDYARLEHYKEDDIPDDIQEQQIELYNSNLDKIRNSITVNEKLLLKIDTLLLELSSSTDNDNNDDDLLSEIEQLTKQLKLYS